MTEATTRTGTDDAHLDLVRSVALAANAALVVDEILEVALDAACAYLGWPVGAVWVEDDGVWVPRSWYAQDDRLLARFRVRTGAIAPSEGVLGAVITTGAPASAWTLSEPTEPGAAVALEVGLTTCLAFSVRVDGEVVAVIQAFAPADHRPRRSVLAAMETICVQIARVIERDRSQRDLHSSRAEFVAAQQLSRVGSWSWDVGADEVRWSAQMFDNFGVAPDAFEGSYPSFLELVHPEDRDELAAAVERALRDGAPFTFQHRTAASPTRWIRCQASVDHDDQGRVRRLWGTAQDVTDIAVRLSDRSAGAIAGSDPVRRSEEFQELLFREDVRHAVRNGDLELCYQPVVSLEDGRMVGLEALVRWETGEGVGAAALVAIAEETGVIGELGAWAIATACRQLSSWLEEHGQPLSVAVNVAPEQLRDPTFVEHVRATLDGCSLPAHALVLEITESTLVGDGYDVAARLGELRDLGVRVMVDDFGTGSSSLSRLREMPLDGLKLDRSFLVPVVSLHDDPPILRALFALADHLDLHVIAEGVETPAQLAALLRHGCDEAQGYLFSRPLTREQVGSLLADPSSTP